jgi:hypothetical protein
MLDVQFWLFNRSTDDKEVVRCLEVTFYHFAPQLQITMKSMRIALHT